jgi:hypothetical protein
MRCSSSIATSAPVPIPTRSGSGGEPAKRTDSGRDVFDYVSPDLIGDLCAKH